MLQKNNVCVFDYLCNDHEKHRKVHKAFRVKLIRHLVLNRGTGQMTRIAFTKIFVVYK